MIKIFKIKEKKMYNDFLLKKYCVPCKVLLII